MTESYKCILADPPWPETGGGGRGCQNHYPPMTTAQIADLGPLVRDIADPAGSHLWMWTTTTYLPDALWAMQAWGFKYKTVLVWGKVMNPATLVDEGLLLADNKLLIPWAKEMWYGWLNSMVQMGIGQYLRGSHELLLFGVRGSHGPGGTSYGQDPTPTVKSLQLYPRTTKHSEKPLEIMREIEKVSPEPRLELFCRSPQPGWSVLGNEVDGQDIRVALECAAGKGQQTLV